jgi:hypothetical protein
MNADDWQRQLLHDPATPYWAKALLRDLWQRDPVEAVNVLQVIGELAIQRADETAQRFESVANKPPAHRPTR